MWRNSQRALKKCANCYCIVLYFVVLYFVAFVDPVRLASEDRIQRSTGWRLLPVSHDGYFGCYLLARQFCCKSRDGQCWQGLWDWSCEQAKEHIRRVCSSRYKSRVKMDSEMNMTRGLRESGRLPSQLCFSSMIPLYLRSLSCLSTSDKYENMWGRPRT